MNRAEWLIFCADAWKLVYETVCLCSERIKKNDFEDFTLLINLFEEAYLTSRGTVVLNLQLRLLHLLTQEHHPNEFVWIPTLAVTLLLLLRLWYAECPPNSRGNAGSMQADLTVLEWVKWSLPAKQLFIYSIRARYHYDTLYVNVCISFFFRQIEIKVRSELFCVWFSSDRE